MGRTTAEVTTSNHESQISATSSGRAASPVSSISANSHTGLGDEEMARASREEDGTRSHWIHTLSRRVPRRVKRWSTTVVRWCKGPIPPRIWKIQPFLPHLQHAPLKLLDRYAPKRFHRFWLLTALYFVFLLCFITILHQSAFSAEIEGYGSPVLLSCASTYWSDKNGCGIDGNDCRPFENATLAFRCPANCIKTQVLNPHAVGTEEVVYKPLVIGGPTDLAPGHTVASAFYRGDSFICGAAIHAGFITDSEGGCGVLSLVGERSNYPSVDLHGIRSVGFDSIFPLSFEFIESTKGDCRDLRWPLLGVSVTLTAILGLFTTSAPIFFWSIFCALFFHCALVSDPPTFSDYYSLVSTAFGRFLPAAFCAFVFYTYAVRRTLTGLTAQVEKIILWLGGCWVGVLNNNTFDKIPIQRLTPHDLKQQPGAVTALVIIVIVLFVIALGQAWAIRMEGTMPRYLALYCFMGFCLGMMAAIPNMNLRIHHYILALLLLPGTALQTRPSLLYQGLLVGLFINGIARWGFDSIIQTPGELQGDAQLKSALPAIIGPTVINGTALSFGWPSFPSADYDGLSILVNDVERFRHYTYDGQTNFTWTRDSPAGDPEYFRFGFMSGSSPQDFTQAGTWLANGEWVAPAEGPSKT